MALANVARPPANAVVCLESATFSPQVAFGESSNFIQPAVCNVAPFIQLHVCENFLAFSLQRHHSLQFRTRENVCMAHLILVIMPCPPLFHQALSSLSSLAHKEIPTQRVSLSSLYSSKMPPSALILLHCMPPASFASRHAALLLLGSPCHPYRTRSPPRHSVLCLLHCHAGSAVSRPLVNTLHIVPSLLASMPAVAWTVTTSLPP